MKTIMTACLVSTMLATSSFGQDEVFSGPQPGETVSPFKVMQISDGLNFQEVPILEQPQAEPAMVVFVHTITEPAIGLMITLEWYANKHKQLGHHYVLLTGDRAATEQQVRRWWQRPFFAKAPMSISMDGAEGPGSYGLNRNVDMTVLIVKENKVVENFAILGPNNEDAPEILAAVAKALGQPVPSAEEIRAELQAERERRRAQRQRENPVFRLAPHAELGALMLRMLYREGNTEEYINEAAEAMLRWAGDDAEKRAAVAKYARAVLDGEFEYPQAARKTLERLAE